jgi:hypothetical protein
LWDIHFEVVGVSSYWIRAVHEYQSPPGSSAGALGGPGNLLDRDMPSHTIVVERHATSVEEVPDKLPQSLGTETKISVGSEICGQLSRAEAFPQEYLVIDEFVDGRPPIGCVDDVCRDTR